ncbi:MAG TPA: response regulator [Vicinamibacterales bacterium]|nr:response regulator [Vicinamibacterales bacterium]
MTVLRRILLVDDDRNVLRGLSELLHEAGYDFVTCDRFTDAKAYLAEHRPDLMITDVRLGAYNGLQLALYARARHAGIPVIVLTGFEDPTLREEAERSGAVFMVKPVRRDELLETMAKLLGPQDAEG